MKGKILRQKILELVEVNWPTHIKELVRNLDYEVDNDNIKKVSYHIKILEKQKRVKSKRIGQALIIWPMDIERLRFIHELIKG